MRMPSKEVQDCRPRLHATKSFYDELAAEVLYPGALFLRPSARPDSLATFCALWGPFATARIRDLLVLGHPRAYLWEPG